MATAAVVSDRGDSCDSLEVDGRVGVVGRNDGSRRMGVEPFWKRSRFFGVDMDRHAYTCIGMRRHEKVWVDMSRSD